MDFNIGYKIGEDIINYKLGQEVFYIDSQYNEQYEYCKECKTSHSIGRKVMSYSKNATIFGFNIEANHCYSYNTKNSFTLKIVIIDEEDNFKTFDVGNIYLSKEDADNMIKKLLTKKEF